MKKPTVRGLIKRERELLALLRLTEKQGAELRAESDRVHNRCAELVKERDAAIQAARASKASLDGLELRLVPGSRRIAEWNDVPVEVLEAVKVANHLDRVVVFSIQHRQQWSDGPHALPENIKYLAVDAYRQAT